MRRTSIARVVNLVLGGVGLELHRKRPPSVLADHNLDALERLERQTLYGALQRARRLGLSPRSVIDVGAAYGTPELYDVFPDARHLLVEPLEEYRPFLERITGTYPYTEYVIAAASSRTGTATVHVHADLVGSSMYLETEESPGLNETQRSVPAVALDHLCADRHLQGPYLVKVDVQGAELTVLSGAARVLDETEYIVLEASLFAFYKGGVQLYDVISFMHERGFAAYDLMGHLYRPLDGALAQVDIAFVKNSGLLRSHHVYATPAQRAAQTEELLATMSRVVQ